MKKFIVGAGIVAMMHSGDAGATAHAAGRDIALPQPKQSVNVDVMQAFRQRKSVRSFAKGKTLPAEDLALLLWAGYGVNRPDGRHTVATALGRDCLALYAVMDGGIYRYDPRAHVLVFISDENLKGKIARQGFVADAAAVIVLVGKFGAFPESPGQRQTAYVNYTAGAASENIFLAAGSLSLATVVMASFDTEFARQSLQLDDSDVPLYIMPVGYPAGKGS